jgi:hypothetical protein
MRKEEAILFQLINDKTIYDIDRYSELLTAISDSILKLINKKLYFLKIKQN